MPPNFALLMPVAYEMSVCTPAFVSDPLLRHALLLMGPAS